MRVVLLGAEGYHPNDRGHTACLVVPEAGVVLDAGTGLYRLGRHLATPQIDIFLTHAHLDHVVGLTYLLGVLWGRDVERVTVHASPATLEAIRAHLFAPALFPVAPSFDTRELGDPVVCGAGARVTSFEVPGHTGGSHGFRVEGPGGSMAYVTDCVADPQADYVAAIRGVNLLIHECNFPDALAQHATPTGHSHTSQVARVAAAAGVKRLVLTHVNPAIPGDDPVGLADAQAIFPASEVGRDEAAYEF